MRRPSPSIRWRHVLLGSAVALLLTALLALLATTADEPSIGSGAGIAGIAFGGFLAGRWTRDAGFLHGGMVAAIWIIVQAFTEMGTAAEVANPLIDLALILLEDIGRLVVGGVFGWLGARSFSPPATRPGRR